MQDTWSREETELAILMNTFAESLLDTPDDEVVRLAAEAGEDVDTTTDATRALLLGGVKAFRQRKLDEAWEEYQRQLVTFRENRVAIPKEPQARRALLNSFFAQYPQAKTTFLTVQHRDFKNFSDDDIESFLKQLGALGVFDAGKDGDDQ